MKKALLILLVSFLFSASCRKSDNHIPYTPVDITLYITQPSMSPLQAISGWVYITGGVRGIILYRFSTDEIFAYERNCPYRPYDECARVEVDETGIIAVDSCCMSKFLLTDGSPLEGPAGMPLKRYNTYFDGSLLRVYN